MALRKSKSGGNWVSQFSYNGKVYVKSTRTGNKKLAQRLDVQFYEDVIKSEEFGESGPITLQQGVDSYLERPTVSSSRLYQDASETRKLLTYISGDLYLHEITDVTVNKLKKKMQKENYSAQYINHLLTAIRNINKMAVEEGFKHSLAQIKTLPIKRLRIRYLSFEEESAMLRNLNPEIRKRGSFKDWNAHDSAILMLDTGMRMSEVVFLKWPSVDFKTKTIRVFRPKVSNESILYFTDRVEAILLKRYARRDSERSHVIDQKLKRAVPQRIEFAMKRCGMNTEEMIQETGVKLSTHNLRKTFACRLVMNGVSIEVVSRMLGHSSIKMTQDSYAFLAPNMGTENAASVINQLNILNSTPLLIAV